MEAPESFASLRTVSILVLLDDAYRPGDPNLMKIIEAEFQSLFFWMMPTGYAFVYSQESNIFVSILVLLDDAYRPFI